MYSSKAQVYYIDARLIFTDYIVAVLHLPCGRYTIVGRGRHVHASLN